MQQRKQSAELNDSPQYGRKPLPAIQQSRHNIHKELQKLNTNGRKLPINKCAKDLNRQFTEKKSGKNL